jgi:hypothetical protein
VSRYGGDGRPRGFSCWDQFLCLSFGQLTYRESLRDIQACLRSVQGKLYHMGFRGRVSKSTVSDANEVHDWRIYAEFAQVLITIARPMYSNESLGFDLDGTVYALDSTTIDLCLSVFPWAHFQSSKGAVKMHTLLDLRGSIPTFIEVSDGKCADVRILDEIVPEAGSFYVLDRGYLDFERLHVFQRSGAFFVTRTKSNVLLRRRYSRDVDFWTGLISDHTVVLKTADSFQHYPDRRSGRSGTGSLPRIRRCVAGSACPRITFSQRYPLSGNDVRASPGPNSAFEAYCRDMCIDTRLPRVVLASGNHPSVDAH